jgi:dUTP pyrophosphatase
MDQAEFQNYLKKLQEIEKNLNEDDDDELDVEFINDIDNLLKKLNQEINVNNTQSSNFLINVKIKKLHDNAVIPTYAKPGDAGMDLVATSIISNTTFDITYGLGVALEIPEGFVGLIFPRSSIRKTDLSLTNCVGVVDSGYRGELQATFKKVYGKNDIRIDEMDYKVGDRVAQIMIIPYPRVNFVESTNLSETDRGVGGFGSTGK